jgi:prevent-host-death family protein
MDKVMEIGSFEAKTRFSQLIEAARNGTEVIVTRRGEPVARILSMGDRGEDISRLLSECDVIRAGARPGPSVRDMKEEGRL